MRSFVFVTMTTLVLSGCQAAIVRDHTAQLSGAIPDLYYEQVLDNIAISIARPDALPYFGLPTQATSANTRALSAGYTPSLSFITAAGTFLGHWIFTGQTTPLTGSNQDQGSMQIAPITDPDKLVLLSAAFHVLAGERSVSETEYRALSCYYNAKRGYGCDGTPNTGTPPELVQIVYYQNMLNNLSAGTWFGTTTKKHCVPKDACYVGHYCDGYVWVDRCHLNEMKEATLVILDIASVSLDALNLGDHPKKPANTTGGAQRPGVQEQIPTYRTPRQQLFPAAPPYLAPTIQ